MRITPAEVDRLARLARLELDEDEAGDMVGQLDRILASMQTLKDVCDREQGTQDGRRNVLRADVCLESAPRPDMLSNAPEQDGEYILVPRTVE